jgi:hypothetical protein
MSKENCKGCGKCQEGKGNQEHNPDDHEKHVCSCGSNPQPTVQVLDRLERPPLYPAKRALMDG